MRLTFTPMVRQANGEILYKGKPQTHYAVAQEISSARAQSKKCKGLRPSVLQEGTPDRPSRHRADAED